MSIRELLRDNTYAGIVEYATSDSRVRATYRNRPPNFGAVPAVFLGAVRVQMVASGDIRQSACEVDVVVVGDVINLEETTEEVDAVADGLVEYFTDRPHLFGSNTVQEPVRMATVAIAVGDVLYDGVVVTLGRILLVRGLS